MSKPEHPPIKAVHGYILASRLGYGAHGSLYEAQDAQGGKAIVKVLRTRDWQDKTRVLSLVEEGVLLTRLHHRCIRRCMSVSSDPPALVLEYIDGTSLEGILAVLEKSGQLFDVARAVNIAHEIASALAYLHGLGIIHGDIHTANILVERSGGVRLIDFASGYWKERRVRVLHEPNWEKPYYTPPEIWEGKALSTASDVYMLGVVLWKMLTGEEPTFVSEPVVGQALPAFVGIEQRRDGLSRELCALVVSLLRLTPEDRPRADTSLLRRLWDLGCTWDDGRGLP